MKVYQCARCSKHFRSAWTDDEADAEYSAKYSYLPKAEYEDTCVVCDDCYKELEAWINSPEGRAYEEKHGVYR